MLLGFFKIQGLKFLIFGIFLSLWRFLFWLVNYNYYADESGTTIWYSFLHGIRYDYSLLFKCFALLLILKFFSWNFYPKKWLEFCFLLIEVVILSLLFLVHVVDLVYFSLEKLHFGAALGEIFTNFQTLLRHVITEYWLWWLLTLSGLVIFGIFYIRHQIRVFGRLVAKGRHRLSFGHLLNFSFSFIFLLLIIVIIGRGGWQDYVQLSRYAYHNNSGRGAYLTMSGGYVLLEEISHPMGKQIVYYFLPPQQVATRVRAMLKQSHTRYLTADNDTKNLALREINYQNAQLVGTKPNIVIIVLENWGLKVNGSEGNYSQSITPNLDALTEKSLVFDRIWSNAQFTGEGFFTIFSGIPYVRPIIRGTAKFMLAFDWDTGGEKSQTISLPWVLQKKGYDSLYLQPYQIGSSYVDILMKKMGIKRVLTKNDYQKKYQDEPQIFSSWAMHDEYIFKFFLAELDKLKEPFLQ